MTMGGKISKQEERRDADAYETLRESQQLLARIIDFLPDATFVIDRAGKVREWNHAIEEMTGVKAEDMLGKGDYEYALPFYGCRRPILIDLVFYLDEDIKSKYSFVKKEGDAFLAEVNLTTNGKPRSLWGKAVPIYDGAGNVIAAIESIRDITERKLADDALKQSERVKSELLARLNEAQHVAMIGSWEWDLRSNQVWWSDETYRIFGVTHDYIPSAGTDGQFIHPDDIAIYAEAFARSMKSGEPINLDIRLSLAGGLLKHCHARGTVIHDDAGKPARFVGTIMDITDRQQAEDQIKHLKNYLANIIDSMPSMLVGMDRDQIVTQWNYQAEKSTGIPAAQAVGHPIANLFPDFAPWIEAMRGELTQRHISSREKFLIEKKGERHFFDLMLYPLVANGVEGAVVRIEDVTEQTRVQEMLVQAEKMMSVGGLAAGMAHEINNPLGIIIQSVQNVERRIDPDFPANHQTATELGVNLHTVKSYFERRQILEFIDSIHTAASRAAKIVANMLQFSRGSMSAMQPVALDALLEQALELARNDYNLRKKYDFKDIEIVREFAPDMPPVDVVSVEIEQVMLNLLKNAAQAMATSTQGRKPRITLRLRREDRYALLEVEDNGPGMTEEVRRRMFEPFFTTKEPGAGTGLGLSVSYMLVTQGHKGLLEVVSSPGKGACFKVRLPLTRRGGENE